MNQKSHARAADKVGFSIALPKGLADTIQRIADEEHRSRNGQIEHFLTLSVAEWKVEKSKVLAYEEAPPENTSIAAEDAGEPGKGLTPAAQLEAAEAAKRRVPAAPYPKHGKR